jgi:hypothetical protein
MMRFACGTTRVSRCVGETTNDATEDMLMDTRLMTGGRLLALTLALGIASMAAPQSASAQWSLEGRVGSALPVGDLTDDPGLDQTAGLAAAAGAMYTFRPTWTIYGEVSGQWFNCDGCDTDVMSWGIDGGLKYILAEQGSALPWIRAGLAFQQVSVDGGDGEWGVGLDSGIGIDWLLTDRFALVPAIRFDTYSADDLTVSYVTIDLGAHVHLYP